jgi:hypothetical protein
MMEDIYTTADETFVWLGCADEQNDRVCSGSPTTMTNTISQFWISNHFGADLTGHGQCEK